MFLVLMLKILAFGMLIFLITLGIFLNSLKYSVFNRESLSGFECGFEVKSVSRSPFSMRFFLILILFLIFDMEMVLVLQFPFLKESLMNYSNFSLLLVVITLFLGTSEEWRRGFLKWAYE